MKNNKINLNQIGSEHGLCMYIPNVDCVVELSNNKAKYFSEIAKKYKDEAKEFRNEAKVYAEQNSDVTMEYINSLEEELIRKINTKQSVGNYALKSEIPTDNNQLSNGSNFITKEITDLTNYTTTSDLNTSLNLKADISGNKDITIQKNNNSAQTLIGKNDNIDVTQTPSEVLRGIKLLSIDKNNKWFSSIESFKSISNSGLTFGIMNYNNDGSSKSNKFFQIIRSYSDDKISLYVEGQQMRYVIEIYINGTSGYRLWSDGYCEQWGYIPDNNVATQTVTFFKPFANTNYNVQLTSYSSQQNQEVYIKTKATDTLTIGAASNNGTEWNVRGYIY